MSTRPTRFWSEVKMSQRVRPIRLAAYTLFLLSVLACMYAAVQATVATHTWRQTRDAIAQQRTTLLASITESQNFINIRLAEQQAGQLSEANAQNLQAFQMQLSHLQRRAQTQVQLRVGLHKAVFDAVFRPWSATPSGSISYTTTAAPASGRTAAPSIVSQPYIAPSELWTDAMLRGLLGVGGLYARYFIAWAAEGVLLILTFPIMFVVFPITLRRAKVRWIHLVRPSAYGLVLIVAILMIECVIMMIENIVGTQYGVQTSLRAAQFGPPLLTFVWWGAVMNSYLKLPRPMIHAIMLTLLNTLLGVVALWNVAPWSKFL